MKTNGGNEDEAASKNVDEGNEENGNDPEKKETVEDNDVKSKSGEDDGEVDGNGDADGNGNGQEDGNGGDDADADADPENDQEHLQLTVGEADKLDTSNVDNEDSLNLTIGEDEAKIFQDEVSHHLAFHSVELD